MGKGTQCVNRNMGLTKSMDQVLHLYRISNKILSFFPLLNKSKGIFIVRMNSNDNNKRKMSSTVPHRPYAHGERPSRCRWTCFEVDARSFEILGIRAPVATCVRPAGYPDDPDEQ